MTIYFIVVLLTVSLLSLVIVQSFPYHKNFSQDSLKGKQKLKKNSSPRIGGLAFFIGLLIGFFLISNKENQYLLIWLSVSVVPVFLVGLLEDITKSINPSYRLIIAIISALVATNTLAIDFNQTRWHWFDQIFLLSGVSLIITIFMISAVTHAINIIDGFNGLMLGFVSIVLIIFSITSYQVNDVFLTQLFLISLASILGLFFVNFPKGKILTGDGGAYSIGFLLAVYSLLLVKRNEFISPWFALMVLIYPVFETVFTIYRRKFLKKTSPILADKLHLHQLIYRSLLPKYFNLTKNNWKRNAATSLLIWLFILPFILFAFYFRAHSLFLIIGIAVFCLCYSFLYVKIIKFSFKRKQK